MGNIKFIANLLGAFAVVFSIGAVTLPTTANALAGCSKTKFKFLKDKRKYNQKNGKFFYAYANGTGKTLTGIKGCGWSGKQKSAARAKSVAMKYCRKNSKNNTCKVTYTFRWGS